MYDRKTIDEMNALSKQVFGSTSKWRKMVEKGVWEPLEEETKRLTFKDGKEEYETVKTPVLHKDQLQKHTLHRYTVSEAMNFMVNVLIKREEIRQAIEKAKEQAKAEQESKDAVMQASGTAV